MGKNYAMTIDLQSCIGCAACSVTCKNENNTDDGINWMHFLKKETGTFPNVRYEFMPALCNHCDNAPCIKACPVTAMYKDEDGLTLHDSDRCIGCKACMAACPYGVISYNKDNPHEYWTSEEAWSELSATPAHVKEATGETLPYYNPERAYNYEAVRSRGVVEKCQLCDHRLKRDEQPYCVERCPSEAMYVGDLNDPDDKIHEILQDEHKTLKDELGTKPKVYYINSF